MSPDAQGRNSLWIEDLERNKETRLTTPPIAPVARSGRQMGSDWRLARGCRRMRSTMSATGGSEDLLMPAIGTNPISASDWSRDSRWLMFSELTLREKRIGLGSSMPIEIGQVEAIFTVCWRLAGRSARLALESLNEAGNYSLIDVLVWGADLNIDVTSYAPAVQTQVGQLRRSLPLGSPGRCSFGPPRWNSGREHDVL